MRIAKNFPDLAAPSSSSWAERNDNMVDSLFMFDEQTPIKQCTYIDLPFGDIGSKIVLSYLYRWHLSSVAYYAIIEGCLACCVRSPVWCNHIM